MVLASRAIPMAAICVILAATLRAQEDREPPTFSTMVATFGTTVVVPGGLTGRIYELPIGTSRLPNFEKIEPIGTIYTRQLFVPPREFSEGFPGITKRFEWFAIDFTGRFYIAKPGSYRFSLESDDGSKLYIDDKLVINADGLGWLNGKCSVKLDVGTHHIRVSYFQGPRYHLYLMLTVAAPGDKQFLPFNTDKFQPPSDLEQWKGDIPEDLTEPVRRNLKYEVPKTEPIISSPIRPPIVVPEGRRNLKDVLRGPTPVVPLSVRVISDHQPVSGLTMDDFVVLDGNNRQQLSSVAYSSQTLDIELLVDMSTPMSAVNKRLQEIVKRAASELDVADRVGVMAFGEKLSERLNLTLNREQLAPALRSGDDSPSAERLQSAIRKNAQLQSVLRSPEASAESKELNSALAVTAHALRDRARNDSRRAIVIVTDNHGAKGVPDRATRDALWRTNVIVCGLLLNNGEIAEPLSESTGDVRQFINATGGEMFNIDEKRIPLAEALQSIRGRYLLTYKAPGGEPKMLHSVSVNLSPAARSRYPNARVLVRGAYVGGEEGEKPPIGALREGK